MGAACARQPESRAYNEEGEDRGTEESARFGKPQVDMRFAGLLRLRRMSCRLNVYPVHRRDKPVSAARKRFNVSWRFSGVAERLAKARNRIVKTMVEIDERVG